MGVEGRARSREARFEEREEHTAQRSPAREVEGGAVAVERASVAGESQHRARRCGRRAQSRAEGLDARGPGHVVGDLRGGGEEAEVLRGGGAVVAVEGERAEGLAGFEGAVEVVVGRGRVERAVEGVEGLAVPSLTVREERVEHVDAKQMKSVVAAREGLAGEGGVVGASAGVAAVPREAGEVRALDAFEARRAGDRGRGEGALPSRVGAVEVTFAVAHTREGVVRDAHEREVAAACAEVEGAAPVVAGFVEASEGAQRDGDVGRAPPEARVVVARRGEVEGAHPRGEGGAGASADHLDATEGEGQVDAVGRGGVRGGAVERAREHLAVEAHGPLRNEQRIEREGEGRGERGLVREAPAPRGHEVGAGVGEARPRGGVVAKGAQRREGARVSLREDVAVVDASRGVVAHAVEQGEAGPRVGVVAHHEGGVNEAREGVVGVGAREHRRGGVDVEARAQHAQRAEGASVVVVEVPPRGVEGAVEGVAREAVGVERGEHRRGAEGGHTRGDHLHGEGESAGARDEGAELVSRGPSVGREAREVACEELRGVVGGERCEGNHALVGHVEALPGAHDRAGVLGAIEKVAEQLGEGAAHAVDAVECEGATAVVEGAGHAVEHDARVVAARGIAEGRRERREHVVAASARVERGGHHGHTVGAERRDERAGERALADAGRSAQHDEARVGVIEKRTHAVEFARASEQRRRCHHGVRALEQEARRHRFARAPTRGVAFEAAHAVLDTTAMMRHATRANSEASCAPAARAAVASDERTRSPADKHRASADGATVRVLPPPLAALLVALLTLVACGARTGLREPTPAPVDAPDDVADAVSDTPDVPLVCTSARDACEAAERCGNGLDDDCNGRVDEGCACTPGAVQTCFAGPPGRRNVGACRDGAQRCQGVGAVGAWGPCEGGIVPTEEVCDGVDNACDGCLRERACPITCPGANDPRVPPTRPFAPYALRGGDFFRGPALRWQWTVRGGPCDEMVARPSFSVTNADARDATFIPRLSGDYTVTLTVVTPEGETRRCTFVVHVEGPGLRIELCWDRNETVDLDLYVRGPRGWGEPWWAQLGDYVPNLNSCSWANCESVNRASEVPIDGGLDFGGTLPPADWGYAHSPLSSCIDGPLGDAWRSRGYCNNPRLDVDNNTFMGRGRPENINIDAPRDGERFRVMAHNFTGTEAHPIVNIYCGGRRVSTVGQAPDLVTGYAAPGLYARGAMWRAVDVTTHVDARGRVTCDVQTLHPPGRAEGYDVTIDDVRF